MKEEEIVKVVGDILTLRRTLFATFVPKEAQQHFRASQREALLGMKAILQHAIDRLDEQSTDGTHPGKSSRSIEITE